MVKARPTPERDATRNSALAIIGMFVLTPMMMPQTKPADRTGSLKSLLFHAPNDALSLPPALESNA